MYEIVTGPLLWVSFLIFFLGSLYRLASMAELAKKEKAIYPFMSWRHSLRSIAHWVVPFAGRNMRLRPVMTVATFAFHLSLLSVPLFLVAHNVMLRESWGFGLWTMPGHLADALSLVVVAGCGFFFVRRLVLPEVFDVTTKSDLLILLAIALPFLTGVLARYQLIAYKPMLVLHILAGEAMLVAVPFTRLSHMLYFFFTRAYMGCEFGNVRHARDW